MMFDHLRAWLRTVKRNQAVHRRARLPRFRGQFERLEDRTVLSASIGAAPADFNFAAHGAWESAHAEAGWHSLHARSAAGATHWEDAPPLAVGDQRVEPAWFGPPAGEHFLLGSQAPPPEPAFFMLVIRIVPPNHESPMDELQPLASMAEPTLGMILPPLAATSSQSDTPTVLPPPPALPAPALVRPVASVSPVASLVSFAALPSATKVELTSPTVKNLGARNAVIGEYSSAFDALLLATGVRESRGFRPHTFDDKLTLSTDDDRDEFVELFKSDLSEDIAVSLDALEREREAIGAVLAELHDFDVRNVEPSHDANYNAKQSTPTTEVHAGETSRPAITQDARFAPNGYAEGGMVLLEPTGDANLSAHDLTAIVADGLMNVEVRPLGIEVSLGVYQAFDVGGSDVGSDAAPAARANTPSRPDVSAESVGSKASERPS